MVSGLFFHRFFPEELKGQWSIFSRLNGFLVNNPNKRKFPTISLALSVTYRYNHGFHGSSLNARVRKF